MDMAKEEMLFRMRQISTSMERLGSTLLQTRLIAPHGFMARGSYCEAIDLTEVVLDEFMAKYGCEHMLVMKIWVELAEMHRLDGNRHEAAQCLSEVSQILKKLPPAEARKLNPYRAGAPIPASN
jgi:hypothetical protein